jgi:hypothetical protein
MKRLTICLLLFPCLAVSLSAQEKPRKEKKDMKGPWSHVVLSASSPDGLTWTIDDGVRLDRASVPCAVVTPDGKIMLYFVDASKKGPETTNCAVSTDGINFKKLGLSIKGMKVRKALDPSILLREDGTFDLYYFGHSPGGKDSKPGDFNKERHRIHRATSGDGVNFVEKGICFAKTGLVDPDVFSWKKKDFMFVFSLQEKKTAIATSRTGSRFNFDGYLHLEGWGTTQPLVVGDKLRMYAFEQRAREGNRVCSFLSTDGIRWTKEEGVRLQAGKGKQFTDPFVVKWKSGYKMYFKTGREE